MCEPKKKTIPIRLTKVNVKKYMARPINCWNDIQKMEGYQSGKWGKQDYPTLLN